MGICGGFGDCLDFVGGNGVVWLGGSNGGVVGYVAFHDMIFTRQFAV